MALNIKPLHDRVIVRRRAERERGGIIIPDTATEKSQDGEVLAVGDGKLREDGNRQPMDVKVGDLVVFSKYGGSDITIDGEDFLILKEDDIYGIIQRAGAASGKKGGK
jgi:chaperonin GroES